MGFKINGIARKLHIARQTVRKYIAYENLPPRRSKTRDEYYKFDQYVEQEHAKGKSLTQLYKEIKSKGFEGSISPFHYHYSYLNKQKQRNAPKEKKKPVDHREPLVPIKNISITVFKDIKGYKLDDQDTKLINTLMTFEWFDHLYNAAKSFYQIIMGNNYSLLTSWIDEYKNTAIAKLSSFVKGIILDKKSGRKCH